MIEPLDGQILHALQLSPRASFRRIADVLGVPEQSVARRYRKLHRDGVVRAVGVTDPRLPGDAQWIVRVHAKSDDLPRLAEALVRRPEVTHANVLSGWTELVCVVRAPLEESSGGLLQRLPRTSSVLAMDVDLILHVYGGPTGTSWTGHGHTLDKDQAAQLQDDWADAPAVRPALPTEADRQLLDALTEDGRMPHARLADRTGWSPARVTRRISALEASATLTYDLEVLPERLGFHVTAMVWMRTAPRHLAQVAERIAGHDEVASVIAVSGPNNLVAVVICRDVEHLYRYVADRLATIAAISSYDIRVRTKRLKQAASVIAHGRLMGARLT
ncbi:Lrp/AsnC family transcriptional regulator [Mycobacterium saskatchewanense]|uniref:Lrp/AsnC family transcriptional regulator n=1 Tax=Mycobacterium saskatchewanense TaxID=220927 RepID=UPI001E63F4CE|nr:Lrp/AsnC family transcriptional regulator [Mycobacterium saskatchewanense]